MILNVPITHVSAEQGNNLLVYCRTDLVLTFLHDMGLETGIAVTGSQDFKAAQ